MENEHRTKNGYEIIETCVIGNLELVIGHNPNAAEPYVSWFCKNKSDYFWGYYCSTIQEAREKLGERYRSECNMPYNQKPDVPPALNTSKELEIIHNGDFVYFADSETKEELDYPSSTFFNRPYSLSDWLNGLAKAKPEYSEFIKANLDELCKRYSRLVAFAAEEAISTKLDRLKMDMYADGGYGEDEANSRALSEIETLEAEAESFKAKKISPEIKNEVIL